MVRKLWKWHDDVAEYTVSLGSLIKFFLLCMHWSSTVQCKYTCYPFPAAGCDKQALFVIVNGLVEACSSKYMQRISSLTAVSSCSGRIFYTLWCVMSEVVMHWAAWCFLTLLASPAPFLHTCALTKHPSWDREGYVPTSMPSLWSLLSSGFVHFQSVDGSSQQVKAIENNMWK